MSEEQKIKVIIRVRPEVANDAVQSRLHNVSNKICVNTHEGNMITLQKDPFHFRDFTFDDILETTATQEETYVRSCQRIVDSFTRDGVDGCVMCYGQSGSGKTFTMFGDALSTVPESSFGVVQYSMKDIFEYVASIDDSTFEVKISVSFYEIYLEKLRDLLAPECAASLKQQCESSSGLSVREYPGRGASVEGLTSVLVKDLDTALRLVRDMKHRRTSRKKQSNGTSSRSHAILRITLEHVLRRRGVVTERRENRIIRSGVLTFCDLAGSERFDLTSTTTKSALDRQETQNINKSIYALGNCIQALSRAAAVGSRRGRTTGASLPHYVPYRDSKLTRLLADSMSMSHTRMCVVCNISPMVYGFAESVCSLTFASRAAAIRKPGPSLVVKKSENIFADEQFEEWQWRPERSDHPAPVVRSAAIVVPPDLGKDNRMCLGEFFSPLVHDVPTVVTTANRNVEDWDGDRDRDRDRDKCDDMFLMNGRETVIEDEDEASVVAAVMSAVRVEEPHQAAPASTMATLESRLSSLEKLILNEKILSEVMSSPILSISDSEHIRINNQESVEVAEIHVMASSENNLIVSDSKKSRCEFALEEQCEENVLLHREIEMLEVKLSKVMELLVAKEKEQCVTNEVLNTKNLQLLATVRALEEKCVDLQMNLSITAINLGEKEKEIIALHQKCAERSDIASCKDSGDEVDRPTFSSGSLESALASQQLTIETLEADMCYQAECFDVEKEVMLEKYIALEGEKSASLVALQAAEGDNAALRAEVALQKEASAELMVLVKKHSDEAQQIRHEFSHLQITSFGKINLLEEMLSTQMQHISSSAAARQCADKVDVLENMLSAQADHVASLTTDNALLRKHVEELEGAVDTHDREMQAYIDELEAASSSREQISSEALAQKQEQLDQCLADCESLRQSLMESEACEISVVMEECETFQELALKSCEIVRLEATVDRLEKQVFLFKHQEKDHDLDRDQIDIVESLKSELKLKQECISEIESEFELQVVEWQTRTQALQLSGRVREDGLMKELLVKENDVSQLTREIERLIVLGQEVEEELTSLRKVNIDLSLTLKQKITAYEELEGILTSGLEEFQSLDSNLKNLRVSSESRVRELQQLLSDRDAAVAVMQKEKDASTMTIQTLNARIVRMEEGRGLSADESITCSVDREESGAEEIERVLARVMDLEAEKCAVESELAELNEAFSNLMTDSDADKEYAAAVVAGLEDSLLRASAEIDEAGAALSEKRREVEDLTAMKSKLETRIAECEALESAQSDHQLAATAKEIEELRARELRLEAEKETAVAQLEASLERAVGEVKDLTHALSDKSEELEQVAADRAALAEHLTGARYREKKLKAEKCAVESELAELNEAFSNLMTDSDGYKETIDNLVLESGFENARNEMHTLQSANEAVKYKELLNESDVVVSALSVKCAAMEVSLERKTAELLSLRAGEADKEYELQRLITENASLEEQLLTALDSKSTSDIERDTTIAGLKETLNSLEESNKRLLDEKLTLEGDVSWHEEANEILSADLLSRKDLIHDLEAALKAKEEQILKLERALEGKSSTPSETNGGHDDRPDKRSEKSSMAELEAIRVELLTARTELVSKQKENISLSSEISSLEAALESAVEEGQGFESALFELQSASDARLKEVDEALFRKEQELEASHLIAHSLQARVSHLETQVLTLEREVEVVSGLDGKPLEEQLHVLSQAAIADKSHLDDVAGSDEGSCSTISSDDSGFRDE